MKVQQNIGAPNIPALCYPCLRIFEPDAQRVCGSCNLQTSLSALHIHFSPVVSSTLHP